MISASGQFGIILIVQRRSRSISHPLIHNILQGFTLLKPAILLKKEPHRLIAASIGVPTGLLAGRDLREVSQPVAPARDVPIGQART